MNEKVRFAIIGCGKIGARHAEQASKYGELIAVCDLIPERAVSLAERFGARSHSSHGDLLTAETDLDLVSVCTPNYLHPEHSIAALNAGKDVLCEKPMSISSQDARNMIDCARKNNRNLFVVKSTRYNPALIRLKEVLDQGKLGAVYSFQLNCFWNRPSLYYKENWRGKLATDGGTLYTQFSHYIDAMLWLFGDVKKLNGFRKNIAHEGDIEFEDSGVVALEMNSGVLGGLNWSVNAYQKNMEVSLTLLAEKGSVRIGGEYLNEVQYNISEEKIAVEGNAGTANEYDFYKGSMSNHDKVYENLVKALRHSDHPFTNAEDGLRTVELIEKVYKTIPLE